MGKSWWRRRQRGCNFFTREHRSPISMISSFSRSGRGPRSFGFKILVTGAVPNIQNDAPDEVGGESTGENHDQNGKSLPDGRRAVV